MLCDRGEQLIKVRNLYLTLISYSTFSDEPAISVQQCASPITEGDSVTLFCNATGNPAPNITWIQQQSGAVLSSSEELVLAAINRSQAGSYRCYASNGIGINSTRTCSLNVFCK